MTDRSRRADLPAERHRHILGEIRQRHTVRANELAEQLGVSVETVRRDLVALEKAGLSKRVYGGATRPTASPFEPPYEERRVAHADAKRSMAEVAASLVEPGSTVMLDIGTSVAEVARLLANDFRGRVLTNSLVAATLLAGRDGIELLVTGGRVRGGDLACFGSHAEALFAGFYGGIAFLGSGAVHPTIGLTDHYIDEIPSRRIIIDHADEVYVMADSSKLGQIAPVKVCELGELTGVITDDRIAPDVKRAFDDAGVHLLIAPLPRERRSRPASVA
jgi:DeoR family transcriptional regulator, fructose operon transcriptional repressor